MRILFFAAIDFYSKPNPSFHLMQAMIADFLSAGHEIYYLGMQDTSVEKHIPDDFLNHKSFIYDLVKTKNVKKSAFVKRYLSGIMYSLRARKYVKKNAKECDVIFVQSSPTVLYNLLIAKQYAGGAKIIYNVQDLFPGSSIASGVMPQKWMQNIFYRLQKVAYKKADKITVISEDMKRKVVEQGVEAEKIEVIVNWFDDTSVREVPWDENRFVKKYSLDKDKFYVQYAGTMGYVFDYKMVLDVAEKLKDEKNIIFQMIGAGSQKEAFIKEAAARQLDNIDFLPLEPQEMVSDVYSACSVCFIPLKRGIIGNSVPSKAGLLMECKRPIVTSVDEDSDFFQVINDNEVGIAASNLDATAIVNAIFKLYQNEDKLITYGENGYAYGHDLYSRKNNMSRYLKLINELTGILS